MSNTNQDSTSEALNVSIQIMVHVLPLNLKLEKPENLMVQSSRGAIEDVLLSDHSASGQVPARRFTETRN